LTTIAHRPARTARRALTATTATVAVLTLATPTAAAAQPETATDVPPPCGALAINQPLQLPATTTTAKPILRRLAANLRAEPADDRRGRYTRITATMTAADTSIGDCVTTDTRRATEQRWRDERADSGQITGTPWHSATEPAPKTVTTGTGSAN
jgi:hypothetical protein